jgi:hypothetical protein
VNSIPARFYAYIFFEIPPELRRQKQICEQAELFFEQWKKAYRLKEGLPFDVGDPEINMLCLAETEGLEVCILRYHDMDIVEIEWGQSSSDEPPQDFWKKCADSLEKQMSSVSSYFGSVRACFAGSSDLTAANINPDWKSAHIPDFGVFYRMGEKHNYLLLSEGKDPGDFLGRDFSLIASFILKLENQEKVMEIVKNQKYENEKNFNAMISSDIKSIEENLTAVKTYYTYLQENANSLARLRQTFGINISNLENYCKRYELYSLFMPILKQAKHKRKQLFYDSNYARLNLEGVTIRLQLAESEIQNRQVKTQQRIERWIALAAIPLGIGGVTTNMPNTLCDWIIRLALMGIGGAAMFALCLWLQRKK